MKQVRLNGWKEIGNFLGRDRTTAIRWAKERGLPVHRVPGGRTRTVYALDHELQEWFRTGLGDECNFADAEPILVGVSQPADRTKTIFQRTVGVAVIGSLLLLAAAVGGWLWMRSTTVVAHSMTVHLPGFQALTSDIPARMSDSINAEITAAFNVDGVVGVSSSPTPLLGPTPEYALDGTVNRIANRLRVITRFTNVKTGAVLWSDGVDYSVSQLPDVPFKIAADAGTVVRCGLSGAATYHRPLPDSVLSNYMQYCQQYWSYGGTKTLRFAKLVVAAVPDFSWGWSAVGNGYMQAANAEPDLERIAALRAKGREAEERALLLDRQNSEALGHMAYLIDPRDWLGMEALFKRALAAKPLDCGCEHYGYGVKLLSVGRLNSAIEQLRAATDMLGLWPDSQLALARALVSADRREQAAPYFEAANDLSKDETFNEWVAINYGVDTGDYIAAIDALRSPKLKIPSQSREALSAGYEALAAGSPKEKARAVQTLVALPEDQRRDIVAMLLAGLGASRDALQDSADRPHLFWRRSMRQVLNEPEFPAVAARLGLFDYWRTSHTKPDACRTKIAPSFCGMI